MMAIKILNLSFKYKDSKEYILSNLSINIKEGEITAILGESGSGKSTLCKCICGLIPKLYQGDISGEVLLFGENINNIALAEVASRVGIIFQNPSTQLFSPTIEDELAFGPENLCVDRNEIGKRIDEILKLIDMQAYRYDNPNNLSGGQQQLIAMASVLMMKPKILICDEIMSWIDEEKKEVIKDILVKLKGEGTTIIMVDHDMENIKIADNIIYI
ncbi:energy-coupling factor transport system ATP-binding protein [Acetoanaerobium noterae]|uniref:Energy-coupling factor transport system ATP-binding protein n=1 Tax=Acetoanaerobium noterae TaxID=745369 RepID=A0A1T5A8E0_9FIRM|nr:ABC transporter ATP-binding protein [Acetoanaerobium noterae]SKB31188.1 energy-coupling factor transport system ATP-binding protein [Acetoanaerobium noterae]